MVYGVEKYRMNIRQVLVLGSLILTAMLVFGLGFFEARTSENRIRAAYDAKLDGIRVEVRRELERSRRSEILGTAGVTGRVGPGTPLLDAPEAARGGAPRAQMIAEITQQLEHEIGLVPLRLLRDRRSSFVEMYSYTNQGERNYGTAGYLGHGYFMTVKHSVVAPKEKEDDKLKEPRRIVSVTVLFHGQEIPARLVDAGDTDVDVDRGDWAIIKVHSTLDLPPLQVDTGFAYEFADPIFRLGNDYSQGILLSSGYVGQKMSNGLVTCLTDGHPGVSGGGVLNQYGFMVGIPVGRMQGDYRLAFILPVRSEMFRRVPGFQPVQAETVVAEAP
jgi:hypothetical protein